MSKVSRRLGEAVLVAAMFMAPINQFRPVPGMHPLTWTDVLLPIGFLLLLPWLLQRRIYIPLPYAFGVLVLVTTVVTCSLSSSNPFVSFNYGGRLIAAAVVIPLAFLWWRPDIRRVDVLVWAYLLGQSVSTLWALHSGPGENGRYDGLSTHVNFFALSGQIAVAFVPYLLTRTPRTLRWVPLTVGSLCAYSVVMSGSRASLVVLFAIAVIYPLVERSLRAAWLVVTGTVLMWVAFPLLFGGLGSGSAFSRLQGDPSSTYSDAERHSAFMSGLSKLLEHPYAGNGFAADSGPGSLAAHDVYLQIAVAGGIFCLVGFVLVLWSLVTPMFGRHPLGRLGYAALSYCLLAFLTPAAWDRFLWMALSVCILAAAPNVEVRRPRPPSTQEATQLALTA